MNVAVVPCPGTDCMVNDPAQCVPGMLYKQTGEDPDTRYTPRCTRQHHRNLCLLLIRFQQVLDRPVEVIHRRFLIQQDRRAGTSHRVAIVVSRVDRDPKDDGPWPVDFNARRGLDPVHLGHIDIHHDYLRLELTNKPHGLRAVLRFSNNLNRRRHPIRTEALGEP